jgi:GrpB-like predicted nucleotidyltransferase (UPF0157 family)
MTGLTDAAGWGPDQERGLRAAWVTEPPQVNGPITLAQYDPAWPALFEREAATIRGLLGDTVLRLEHIGSTSVPGLAAKPIIDMLLVIEDPAQEDRYVPQLEGAGFRLAIREPDWYEHRVLKGTGVAINLHVLPPQSPEIDRYLRFRGQLRADESDRELYERTKRELSGRTWTYVQQYADAKSQVVEAILARC